MLYEGELDAAAQAFDYCPRPWKIVKDGRWFNLVDNTGETIIQEKDTMRDIAEYLLTAINAIPVRDEPRDMD